MERLSTDSRVTRDFPPDARYLIGVSGGRDSVALLHWLISLGYERPDRLPLESSIARTIGRCRCSVCEQAG